MKNRIRFFTLVAASLLFASTADAQETVATAGGSANGSGGTLSYIIGQTFYAPSGGLTPGVMQSYTITEVAVGDIAEEFGLQLTAYPNPTVDQLMLSSGSQDINNTTYTLADLNGRTIRSGSVENSLTQIDVSGIAIGVYLLTVRQNNNLIKTFKIVKN